MIELLKKNKDIWQFVLLLFISILPGIKYLGLIIQISLFFYYYFKNDKIHFSILLFTFPLFSEAITIYKFKIIYGLIFFTLIIELKKILTFKIKKKYINFIVFYGMFFIIFSFLKNFYNESFSFISDFIIIIGYIFGFFFFYDFDWEQLEIVAIKLLLIQIIISLIAVITGYGFSETVDFLGDKKLLIGVGESCFVLFIFALHKLFFSNTKLYIRILIGLLFVFTSIKTRTLGSLVILCFLICFCVLLIKKILYSKHFIICICFFIGVSTIFGSFFVPKIMGLRTDALKYKWENITNLVLNFSFTDRNKIYSIPYSPYVRVVELINITHENNLYTFIFGNGLGGTYTDSYFNFETQYRKIGQDAFSYKELNNHVFYSAHNIGYAYLKYGLIYFIFVVFVALLKYRKNMSVKMKYYSIAFVIVFFVIPGYTLQNAICLGLIVSLYLNKSKFIEIYETNI